MPRVFITQLPSRIEAGQWVPSVDVSPAREHGELVFMVPHGINFPSADMVMTQITENLLDFNEEIDCLLPMGDPVVMACAAAILGARMNSFKMLKWDRQSRCYIPYRVTLQDAQSLRRV